MARVIEADWVVVGGGSGGCVMAGRLSEDPDLVRESGSGAEATQDLATDPKGVLLR